MGGGTSKPKKIHQNQVGSESQTKTTQFQNGSINNSKGHSRNASQNNSTQKSKSKRAEIQKKREYLIGNPNNFTHKIMEGHIFENRFSQDYVSYRKSESDLGKDSFNYQDFFGGSVTARTFQEKQLVSLCAAASKHNDLKILKNVMRKIAYKAVRTVRIHVREGFVLINS